jgi:hypothetical protein
MSIANLFVPNDLNLYCGTITSSGGGGGDTFATINVTNQILMTTPASHPLQINLTSNTSEGDISFYEKGALILGIGDNVEASESYIWNYANRPLKIGVNDIEVLNIPAVGIAPSETAPTLLGVNVDGVTVISRPISGLSSHASWYLANDVSLVNGTATPVAWDTISAANPYITIGTLPGAIMTINNAGLYIFTATLSFITNNNGVRSMYFLRNAFPYQYAYQQANAITITGAQGLTVTYSDTFVEGETMSLYAVANFTTGTTGLTGLNAPSLNTYCRIDVALIAA